MRRFGKTFIHTLITLVILSNVNYSVASAFCGMSKSSECECKNICKPEYENQLSSFLSKFKSNSCCEIQLIQIQNSSKFENNQNPSSKLIALKFHLSDSDVSINLTRTIIPYSDLSSLFNRKNSIPVLYSSLLI
ncbi:MAG: hypothetical protein HGGPFJEG_00628 [Ignavibacteria bacterium]|nr:hypothetical protein [Ignavibacteria bacterium]